MAYFVEDSGSYAAQTLSAGVFVSLVLCLRPGVASLVLRCGLTSLYLGSIAWVLIVYS